MSGRMVDIDSLELTVSGRDGRIYLTPLIDGDKMDMDYRREYTKESTVAIANWMLENGNVFINVGEGETFIFNISDANLVESIQKLMDEDMVVVPNIVSQWYESNRDNLDQATREMIMDVSNLNDVDPWNLTVLQKWFIEEDIIDILSKMRYGYLIQD